MKTSTLHFIMIWAIVLSVCAACAGKTITVNIAGGADFASIQAAIADAGTINGDQIQVAPGTYNEVIDFFGKIVRLYSSGGAVVTTIDGTGYFYAVVKCIHSESPGTILEGFTITGGNGAFGSGMYNINSSPTVSNCTFSGNSTGDDGGGMYNSNSSPTVSNCIFSGNSADLYGGGMCNIDSSSPVVKNCKFLDNEASTGGGIFNENNSSPAMTNCVINNNTADAGGGMCIYDSNPSVTNCTISSNLANSVGGGMFSNGSPSVTNCIFQGNIPEQIYDATGVNASVTYSDVQGGYTGTGNINADPNFINAALGNLRLSHNSPCIDRGKNSAVPAYVTADLSGRSRFIDVLYVADLGTGTVPIVDMGAYEFLPADIDGSGIVNDADFEILSSYWLWADSDYHLWEDTFEADSSSQYTFEDSYGSGGSFSISGGTLNITPAYDNTAAVMTSNPVVFAVGDTLSLDVPGLTGSSQAAIMMCSTTAGHPNGTTTFGFRFRRDAEGSGSYYFRMNLFPGSAQAGITDPSPTKPATLKIVRVSYADFVYSVVIEGFQTMLGSFSLSQLSGITNLHVGAQAYRYTTSHTFIFDNLRVFKHGCSDGTNLNGDIIVDMEDLMEMVEYWLAGSQ